MKKNTGDLARAERGQSMVLIALVFVGLVALAGLAIDGGNLFVQRRQAQAAADASAVAGTRLVSQAIQTCSPIDTAALDAEIDRTPDAITDLVERLDRDVDAPGRAVYRGDLLAVHLLAAGST